jgi:hypothetical protein
MVDRRRAIAAAVVVPAALLAGLWWFLRGPSAEERIRSQLDALCRLVSKPAGETAVQAALAARALQPLFADPVEVRGEAGPVAGVHAPAELAARVAGGRAALQTFELSYTDLTVELRPPEEAEIRFTARARTGADDMYRHVVAHLRRAGGVWVFSRFQVVNVMKGQ